MLKKFEEICRKAWQFSDEQLNSHEFESRDIHQLFFGQVKRLFDDGHYRQSVFEACQIIENSVQNITGSHNFGRSLMEQAFKTTAPEIQLANVSTEKGVKEQRGFQEIYCGMIGAIRNPRGHDSTRVDDMEGCLSMLGFLSAVCRFVEQAGYVMDPFAPNP